MDKHYDAVIVGAGIIGASVGLELARQGLKTLNIDKLPAAGYGSTSNSCAVIRVYYSTVDSTALAYDSYFYWKNWQKHLGAESVEGLAKFHHAGTLVMQTEENKYLSHILPTMDKLKIPYEIWPAEQIQRKLPIYRLDSFAPAKLMQDAGFGEGNGGSIEAGVFFPSGGFISDPQLATQNVQRACERAGGSFLFNAEIVDIPRESNRVQGVVLADGTRIAAPIVVNVAGPHSSRINKMAGADGDMRISTRPVRQEVVHLPSPAGFDFEHDGLTVSDSDIAVYCRPETGNHILVGSEDPPCDEMEVVDPDDFNRSLTDQGLTQAYRYAQRVPSLEVSPRPKGVVDLYDVSDDWIPIYDRSSLGGFYMAVGTSGNQFKNAPLAGKLMAHLIERCEAGHDHDRDPLRFALTHVDHQLDLASFSRLREINRQSSFSVLG